MNRLWLLPVVGLVLSGCRTSVYSTEVTPSSSAGPSEYSIRGTSPGGMYGGFIGTSPSADALKGEAEQLCPSGYDKLYERAGAFFEGKSIEWRIRCHVDP